MILPPFIQYVNYKVEFIPFESLFEIDKISAYHRVISMKNFLANLAEDVWPKSNRSIACYGPRSFSAEKNSDQDVGCNPFEGSPFKDFWSHIGVEEFPSGSLFYKPLHTDFNYASEWKAKFNHIKVLAFVGRLLIFFCFDIFETSKIFNFKFLIYSKVLHHRSRLINSQWSYLNIFISPKM